MKKFTYQISDPEFSKKTEIDTTKFHKIEDLKRQIAKEIHVDPSRLSVEYPKKDQQLESIPENTKIQIKIKDCCKEIKFDLPNNKTAKISDGYQFKFIDIIQKFEIKDFHCSLSFAKNNIDFNFDDETYHGKDLQKERYPFLGVPNRTIVALELTGDYNIIDFDKKKFYFSLSDSILNVKNLIFSSFRSKLQYNSITVSKLNEKDPLPASYKLKKDEKYEIHADSVFYFKNVSSQRYNFTYQADYFTTVLSARDFIYTKFGRDKFGRETKMKDDFHILTSSKSDDKADGRQPLQSIQDEDGNIFYDIDGIEKDPATQETQEETKEKTKQKPKSKPSVRNFVPKKKETKVKVMNPKDEEEDSTHSDDDGGKEDEDEEPKFVKVKFEFDGDDSEKYSPFIKKVSADIEFKDFKKVIRDRCNIDDDFSIFYPISKERKMKIDSNSGLTNFLYQKSDKITFLVKINKTTKSKASSVPPKSFRPTRGKASFKPKKTKTFSDDEEKTTKRRRSSDDEKDTKRRGSSDDEGRSKKQSQKKKKSESDSSEGEIEYSYQLIGRDDDEMKQIKLKKGATVKDFKAKISKENDNVSISCIKIIFASKDLLNDIVLDELEVEDTPLYVYITPLEDVFATTALALKVDVNEDYDDDDDDDNKSGNDDDDDDDD